MKNKSPNIFNKISFLLNSEKDYFLENLSLLLSSGMDMGAAIASIEQDIKSVVVRERISIVRQEIESGSPLWKSLENTKFIAKYAISLIRIGEETGQLAENLKIAVEQQQAEKESRSKLKSALIYPALVLFLTISIGIGISWFILPKLATVFSQLNLKLPLITKVLLGFGVFLDNYGVVAVPLIFLALFGMYYFLFVYKNTKYIGEAILLSIPVIKRLVLETEVSRFGFILGTLMNAGLPVVESILSLSDATSTSRYRKFYQTLAKDINDGNSFENSFHMNPQSSRYLPTPVQNIISSAEKSGYLPDSLLKVGSIYESKVEITTKNFNVLIEPIMLIVIWAGVVMVALAVILPIYSLIGGLNP